MYLSAISSPTEAGKASQAIHLRMMNLSDQDSQAAVTILASFRGRRQQLIKDYNAKATEANQQGKPVDPAVRQAFFANLNSLVLKTRDDFKSTLSPQGWGAFNGHVQDQKRGMTIPASEGVK